MAEQNRPASPQQAPDPANSYERSKPQNEAGMGRLDSEKTVPPAAPDRPHHAVTHKQDPTRQINGEDIDLPKRPKEPAKE